MTKGISPFFLCNQNDELTLPVAEDSHLLNALQICLMDASCHGLAVTSTSQKYFPMGLDWVIRFQPCSHSEKYEKAGNGVLCF